MTLTEWQDICGEMLSKQLTSNSLFHDDEEAKKHREQIYVPLALVERKKSEKRQQDQLSPEQGTKLYEPQYEEKQRFAHDAFLENILRQKQGKTHGKRIALIGEPGAGKTTLLQTIGNWVLQQGLGLPVWVSLADLTDSGNLRNLRDYLLESWLSFAVSDSGERVRDNFTEQFERERVWLLLDGVDEIATSGSQTLQNISRQLSGWVGKARVVLTCRLNVWQADVNALSEFETFRLLDFDYPQQVHQFIDNWFNPPQPPFERGGQEDFLEKGGRQDFLEKRGQQDFLPSLEKLDPPLPPLERGENSGSGDRLKVELGKEEKARVRDLVQNPLRLALLCRSWQLYEGSLPETKAELYGQFVEQFYRWKSVIFPIKKGKQRELNLALGRLAKDDIDSSGSRFRLRQDFIVERLGDADDENSLFYLALQIGWLNNVGVAAESPTKKVYAFFHASFEEYFAAVAINDWDFFLPRAHENKPVEGGRYRIFESQWKQVILLWLGRENMEAKEKEEFIKALTEFQDGCRNFSLKRKIDRGFYEYRAYFLAAAGIGEFSQCSQTDKIVKRVFAWGKRAFTYIKTSWNPLGKEITTEANAALLETPRKNTINALVQLLGSTIPLLESTANPLARFFRRSTSHNDVPWQAAERLGKIGKGNESAINALVQLLGSTFEHRLYSVFSPSDDEVRRQAAESLGEIDPGNKKAISALVHLLESTSDDKVRRQAAESLGNIDPGNEKAISALVHLLESTSNSWDRREVAESLGKIGKGNEKGINALVQLLESTSNDEVRLEAAESLGKIDPGNKKAISALVHLLASTSDDRYYREVAYSLEKIYLGNEKAISALVHLLESTSNDEVRLQAAYILGEIDPSNEKAISALVHLLESTSNDEVRLQAAYGLGGIDPGNEKAISALVHLLESTSNDEVCLQAAYGLGGIDPGNEKAIGALVHLLESTSNDEVCLQAAYGLGGIDPGNEKVINTLVQLLESISNDEVRLQAAYALGEIDPGNEKAINTFVQLLESISNDEVRLQAAYALGEIDPGNEKAINTFVQLLESISNDEVRWQAAYALGEIDPGNEKAINALVHLLESASDYIRLQATKSLGEIGVGNEKAINALVHLLGYSANLSRRGEAAEILGQILIEKQMAKVVTSLKDYLIKSDRFKECYEVIWKCTQTLSYPEFYQAWHPPFRFRFKKLRQLFFLLYFLLGLVLVNFETLGQFPMIVTLIEHLVFAYRPMNTQDWSVVGVTLLVYGAIALTIRFLVLDFCELVTYLIIQAYVGG